MASPSRSRLRQRTDLAVGVGPPRDGVKTRFVKASCKSALGKLKGSIRSPAGFRHNKARSMRESSMLGACREASGKERVLRIPKQKARDLAFEGPGTKPGACDRKLGERISEREYPAV
jgi:hypothetical protein